MIIIIKHDIIFISLLWVRYELFLRSHYLMIENKCRLAKIVRLNTNLWTTYSQKKIQKKPTLLCFWWLVLAFFGVAQCAMHTPQLLRNNKYLVYLEKYDVVEVSQEEYVKLYFNPKLNCWADKECLNSGS